MDTYVYEFHVTKKYCDVAFFGNASPQLSILEGKPQVIQNSRMNKFLEGKHPFDTHRVRRIAKALEISLRLCVVENNNIILNVYNLI